MAWIQPFELKTLLINVFAGDPDYFGAIAILVITTMAAMFRMSSIGLFFMLGLFVLMFSGYISFSFITLFAVIGGLVAGFWISRFMK